MWGAKGAFNRVREHFLSVEIEQSEGCRDVRDRHFAAVSTKALNGRYNNGQVYARRPLLKFGSSSARARELGSFCQNCVYDYFPIRARSHRMSGPKSLLRCLKQPSDLAMRKAPTFRSPNKSIVPLAHTERRA